MATRKCPICKGIGEGRETGNVPYSLKYTFPCPHCKGTGRQHQEWVAGDE